MECIIKKYLSTRLGLAYKVNDKLLTGFTYNYINSKPLIKEVDKTTLTNPSNSVLDSLITTLGSNEYDKTLNSLNYHLIYDIDTIGRNYLLILITLIINMKPIESLIHNHSFRIINLFQTV